MERSKGVLYTYGRYNIADLLVPPDSRIHTDSAWVEENIPYKTRIAQFIIADDNVLTKDTLLAVSKSASWKNFLSGICGQRRPRSAARRAFGVRFSESMDTE